MTDTAPSVPDVLLAEFDDAAACARAIDGARQHGVTGFEVYMPYPAEVIQEALQVKPSPLPRLTFAAGLLGACAAYGILYYTNVVDYPINVGGRPDHAVLAFIPITFETLVLFAGFAAFLGSLILGGLPRLYHPVDELKTFRLVSVDRYLLEIRPTDRRQDLAQVETTLRDAGALFIHAMDPETGEIRTREQGT